MTLLEETERAAVERAAELDRDDFYLVALAAGSNPFEWNTGNRTRAELDPLVEYDTACHFVLARTCAFSVTR